jgi:hypothetical protein
MGLVHEGLVSGTQPGVWKITDNGRAHLRDAKKKEV